MTRSSAISGLAVTLGMGRESDLVEFRSGPERHDRIVANAIVSRSPDGGWMRSRAEVCLLRRVVPAARFEGGC